MERARAWVEACIGGPIERLEPLPGGAGARSYFRVHKSGVHKTDRVHEKVEGGAHTDDAGTRILMHALPEDDAILPEPLRGRDPVAEFVEATRVLAAAGAPVPELFAVEPDERWILLEDLGGTHLCDLEPRERLERTGEAVDVLARLHQVEPPERLPFSRRFDAAWARFELEHFEKHGMDSKPPRGLGSALDALAEAMAGLPARLSLRDYQSQNLMIDAEGRLRLLDYQDAFRAPVELDLVALLHDSYVELTPAERAGLLERYARAAGDAPTPACLAIVTVQRKCKDLARYRYVSRVKGDSRYAPYASAARDSVLGALPALPPTLRECAALLDRVLRAEAP